MALVNDKVNRARGRIVQSPERIKRNIATMSVTAAEDKKTVNMHETKIRDLQAKIGALQNIERVTCFRAILRILGYGTDWLWVRMFALVLSNFKPSRRNRKLLTSHKRS